MDEQIPDTHTEIVEIKFRGRMFDDGEGWSERSFAPMQDFKITAFYQTGSGPEDHWRVCLEITNSEEYVLRKETAVRLARALLNAANELPDA